MHEETMVLETPEPSVSMPAELKPLIEGLERSEPRRRWLYDWVQSYVQSLMGLSAVEARGKHYRWTIGDLINELRHEYGESADTLIEEFYSYLDEQYHLEITLNMLYKAARLSALFPPEYRFREIPYSVYQIIGEISVSASDTMEATRRRRELILDLREAKRRGTYIPTDYHAIRSFCESILKERYGLPQSPIAVPVKMRVMEVVEPEPIPAPTPVLQPEVVDAVVEPIAVSAPRYRVQRYWLQSEEDWFELTLTVSEPAGTVSTQVQSAVEQMIQFLIDAGYPIERFDT